MNFISYYQLVRIIALAELEDKQWFDKLELNTVATDYAAQRSPVAAAHEVVWNTMLLHVPTLQGVSFPRYD